MQKKEKPTISVVILTKNEELMIANCLETVQWADEVIVVDCGSSDRTVEIAERANAMVVKSSGKSFAEWRNEGLKKVSGEWIMYLDADERVTPQLLKVIEQLSQQTEYSSFEIKRNNIHYGKWFQHGGWQTDYVPRLFFKDSFQKWTGIVHETPQFEGKMGRIEEPLVHLTHRSMVDGLLKSVEWTGYEAELLFQAKHPPVTALTLFRKASMEFFRRLVIKKGYKDGIEGWIEAMTQAMNRFIVYERLWELQRKPSLEETYKKIDETIIEQWNRKN